jgi:hypothetical protein
MLKVRFEVGLVPRTQQSLPYAQWVQQKPPTEWRLLAKIQAEVPGIVRVVMQVVPSSGSTKVREYSMEVRVLYEVANQNDWGVKRWVSRLESRLELPAEPGVQLWWFSFGSDWAYWLERGGFISRLRGEARMLSPRQSSWYRTEVPVEIALG